MRAEPLAFRHVWVDDVPSSVVYPISDLETADDAFSDLDINGVRAVDFFMSDGSRVRVRRRHPVSEFPHVG